MKKIIILLAVTFTIIAVNYPDKNNKPKNILFISIDDLRPELGCYGQTQIISPNIDSLASRAIVFKMLFAMSQSCASRASKTGRGLTNIAL